ncbi:DUF6728 family protein [Rapidithrix thailandica]|uniref:DUF6728 family protein n=1 Tax=Rapidithrix thailandica TaxID=413964 RepID=A0AAW9S2R3_9BACT
MSSKSNKNSIGDYFALGEVLGYFFRKKDPNHKPGFSLKMMHGINKLSIAMFLIAIVVLVVRRLFIG